MKHLIRELYDDEAGFILSAELILVSTIAVLSMVVGLSELAENVFLSVPGDGGVTDGLLKETQAGVVEGSAEAISEILLGWLEEWRRTGTVSYQGRESEIAKYSRQKQTEKLALVLDRVCRG